MSELLGVTVEDLVATAKERNTRIPSEIGAFVALEVCESLLAGPAAVRASEVRIAEDGTISVFAPPNSATSEDAARAVVALLAALLVAAGTSVPRGLVSLLDAGPSSGRWDLDALRDDLEASLVPLNRAAARRVLARMLRDVRRPRSTRPAVAEPPPRDATLDAQLDALLDGQGIPAPPRLPTPAELDAELDATLSETDHPEPDDATLHDEVVAAPARRVPSDAPTEPPPNRPATPPRVASLSVEPTRTRAEETTALLDEPEVAKRGGAVAWLLAFVALITATAAAVALLRPDLVDALLGRERPDTAAGPTDEERALAERERRARFGTLVVEVGAERAQVLMYVGRGPAVADDLPVGVAHEFVAIADGRRPTRALVARDAPWQAEGDARRYELAMQAGSEPMTELDLGASELPADVGRPSGALGSVRIVTNPPGAKVYVLVGFAPSVTVENVRTDEALELLVAAPGARVERVVVGPSDWEAQPDGSKIARISLAQR